MKTILLSFLVLLCVSVRAQLIPAARTYNWQPGVNVGVIGGIPSRTTIYTNVVTAGADATGHSDASGIINAAITACQADQVVYIPAGTFAISNALLLNGTFNARGNRVLRGAGMGQTILKFYNSGSASIAIGNSQFPRPSTSLAVTAGASQGSNVLIVADASSVTANRFIRLEQANPDYVFEDQGGGYSPHSMSVLLWVTNKTSTTISVQEPIPANFTNSPTVVVYDQSLITFYVGLEDFTMDMAGTSVPTGILAENTWFSWVKGVEIKNANSHQMYLTSCGHLDIRRNYCHDARSSGPSHEGIDCADAVCWSLIEDNICVKAGFPQIILGDSKGGCMGNVIDYNYVANTDSGSSVAGGALSVNHGPHNAFNLVEGNVAQMFQSDGYYGSSSDNTAFRNWFTGVYAGLDYPIAVNLDRWSYRFNLYGNVLGSNSYSAVYVAIGNPAANSPAVYRLGYPNMGNAFFNAGQTNPPSAVIDALDLNVSTSLLRTNNYDYVNNAVINPYVGTLPASLIYTNGAPSWWGSQRWPAIDPNASPKVVNIPAQDRFAGIVSGGGGQGNSTTYYFPARLN